MRREHLDIKTDGAVRILTMTGKPRRGNPLSRELAFELVAELIETEQDASIHALVLAGTETHFSVGADLAEVSQMTGIGAVLADWLEQFDRFAEARKPTIAAVRGHAVGGGFELALSCDILVCAEDANLALPETGIGVIAGQGGTQRLIQMAGRGDCLGFNIDRPVTVRKGGKHPWHRCAELPSRPGHRGSHRDRKENRRAQRAGGALRTGGDPRGCRAPDAPVA